MSTAYEGTFGPCLDLSNNAVTSLATFDFEISLVSPSDVVVYSKEASGAATVTTTPVVVAHAGAGLYAVNITLPDSGIYRLSLNQPTYGPSTTYEIIVGAGIDTTYADMSTVADIETYVGSGTYSTAQIEQAITWASVIIQSYCGRVFSSDTYTERIYGAGNRYLITSNYPITSITSIYPVDSDGVLGTVISASDYRIGDNGRWIERYSDSWDDTWHAHGYWSRCTEYEITYVAGYSSIPADVHYATTRLAVDLLNSASLNGNLKREKFARYEYERAGAALLDTYKSELAAYKTITI